MRSFFRFLDIGMLSKNNLYDNFCLLINFSKSATKPSEISIEVLANLNSLLLSCKYKFGR